MVVKLFIGIPCQFGFSVEFHTCLANLIRSAKTPMMMSICKSPGVGISRNLLTHDFLETDADKLLMWDADVLASPSHVTRITSHDEPLVGGLYCKKEKQGRPCLEALPDGKSVKNARGLVPVRYIGTGFMCIARHLIEEIKRDYPEIWYNEEQTDRRLHDFWTVGVHPVLRRYLTEDWWFCERTSGLGYTVYADSEVMLQHEGRAIYPLELNEE